MTVSIGLSVGWPRKWWVYYHSNRVVRQGDYTSGGEEEYYLGGDKWSERTMNHYCFVHSRISWYRVELGCTIFRKGDTYSMCA
jgi:hypothetical protein